MKKKIQQWGKTWLNLARRVILLKAILSNLPLYNFSLIQVPISIHNKLEKILRQLIWQGGKSDKKKFSLVKWRQVTTKYESGGLFVWILKLLNVAFGGKIVWHLISVLQSWWKLVLGKTI